ncbi:PREDICTED: VPS9 domain-containing protein 1, partial [Corvus brachyrhynchos]|uniref:VPS9 domain-containing protein 1 n=1 Tax=Corvus brachyrhynchos TaxID=85066 RepID=UPI0008166822
CIPGLLLYPCAPFASPASPASLGSPRIAGVRPPVSPPAAGLHCRSHPASRGSAASRGAHRIPGLTPHSRGCIPGLTQHPRTSLAPPGSPRLPFGPGPCDPPGGSRAPPAPGVPAQPPLWQEAYVEYLKSITLIAQALQEEAAGTENSEGVTPDTPKLLKLAEQCLERVKSIAAALGKAQVKPAAQERGGGPTPLSRHRRVCSDEGGKLSPFLPPEIFQKLQIAEAQSARKGGAGSQAGRGFLGDPPLPTAGHGVWVDVPNAPPALQTLSLQRQMMENLVIAKAREETLQRKREERRLRLQEAANRRFSSSVALTPEEQEQRALYAAILEYEQDHDWPRQWKAQLKRSPADLSVVSGLFSCLLRYCRGWCLACLEEAFFPPLWAPLLALYRTVQQPREAALARSMERHRHARPAAVLGHQSLWPPWLTSPCCHSGADDLLPILSYVVLQTGLPQLLSECTALEEFIHEGYLIGEEGYCLTSLQSALSYVESLQ